MCLAFNMEKVSYVWQSIDEASTWCVSRLLWPQFFMNSNKRPSLADLKAKTASSKLVTNVEAIKGGGLDVCHVV